MKSRLYLFVLSLMLLSGLNLAQAEEDELEEDIPETMYVDLSPAFLVNLGNSSSSTEYLKADVQVVVSGEDTSERVSFHSAPIRHELLMLLGTKTKKELQSVQVRQEILDQALISINEHLDSLEKNLSVNEVLFTSFILQ